MRFWRFWRFGRFFEVLNGFGGSSSGNREDFRRNFEEVREGSKQFGRELRWFQEEHQGLRQNLLHKHLGEAKDLLIGSRSTIRGLHRYQLADRGLISHRTGHRECARTPTTARSTALAQVAVRWAKYSRKSHFRYECFASDSQSNHHE